MTSAPLAPGRTEVRARAYERLARAVAAQHLGVAPSAVSASVHDAEGLLGIRVDAPLALRGGAQGNSVSSTAAAVRERIALDLTELTSAELAPLDVRVTRVEASATRVPVAETLTATGTATTGATAGAAADATAGASTPRIERTLARRFVHRSRSTAVSLALLPVVVLAVWIATESTLALLGAAPLLADPSAAIEALVSVSSGASAPIVLAAAGALAALGVAASVLALAPGRRDRRRVSSGRHVIIVDDAVLASAFSARAARAASIGRDQVRTALGRRRGEVAVTATSGFAVDTATVSTAVDELETALAPSPRLRLTPTIASHGRLAR